MSIYRVLSPIAVEEFHKSFGHQSALRAVSFTVENGEISAFSVPAGAIASLTMAAAGGCWWPIDLEPRWMRTVALAFPTTWAMEAYNDLMIRRWPASAVLRSTLVLFAHGAAYLLLGLVLFRRRLARVA